MIPEILLPFDVMYAVSKILKYFPDLATADGAEDRCGEMSSLLIQEIKEHTCYGLAPEPHLVGTHWHVWVKIADINIDLTAKQFSEKEPCPKIWRDGNDHAPALPPWNNMVDYQDYTSFLNAINNYNDQRTTTGTNAGSQ